MMRCTPRRNAGLRYAAFHILITVVAAGSASAFLAGAAAARQQTDPSARPSSHDPGLTAILGMDPGPALLDSASAYEDRTGIALNDTLAEIAEDPALHPVVRANAALLIGRRHDLAHFIILRPLLAEPDPRIRLAAVAAAQEFLPVFPEESLAILRTALRDTVQAVQVRALEAMTDRDLDALRDFLAAGPPSDLATIARDLVRAGERRGAPLVPDAAGTLRKTGPAGGSLIYTPRRSWPADGLSAGRLDLVTPDGQTRTLGDSVEVARNVVPAFFSNDGSRIVFENARSIRLHDVAAGRTQLVGPGIAPRPLPFTEDFVFAVPIDSATTKTREKTSLAYMLQRAPFAGDPVTTETIGALGATASFDLSGGASPVRWMRVVEKARYFGLEGDGLQPVPLPDPFRGSDP